MRVKKITGLILAGGAGRRVEGQDKGWLIYQGMSLVERQINWLKPQVDQIIISANRHIDDYKALGYPVLQDQQAGFQGPLQGILQGVSQGSQSDHWLWVQAVDMPNLPSDLIAQTERAMDSHSICAYLATETRQHYLTMLIQQSCVTALSEFVATGNARVRDFHHLINSQAIMLDIDESQFENLNTSHDYQ